MNLWLDSDVTRCAQAHQDAHVGKMLLEAVQLLCTAFRERRNVCIPAPKPRAFIGEPPRRFDQVLPDCSSPWQALNPDERLAADLLPYSHTHVNHPCALWVRASRANFDRAIELAEALAAEFRYRFDKPHGSEAALDWVQRHRSEAQVPDGSLTPYALAMPEAYIPNGAACQWPGSCISTYRAYYRAEKRGHWRKSRDPAKPSTWVPAKWTRRDPPEWF